MLARAARRKLRRDAFTPQPRISEQLTLPWLCPAQIRWVASARPLSASTTSESPAQKRQTRRTPPSLSSRHETRSLATAADIHSPKIDPFPFASPIAPFAQSQSWGVQRPNPELSKLHSWDTSKPLIVHDATSSAHPVTPIVGGIGGDPSELHQNLYACLRVGRMDRGMAILRRLVDMYDPSAAELADAHNIFLRTLFEQAAEDPTDNSMTEVENWYKTHIIGRGIAPTAQTFVTLIRASMTFLVAGEKEAALRKYLAQALECGQSVLEEVNSSPDFTEEEWDTLIRFQPNIFEEPPPVEEVQQIQFSTPRGQQLAIEHGFIPDPSLIVTPVPQKGLGLTTLKKALRSMETPLQDVPYPHELAGTKEEKDRAHAYLRQLRLEQDGTQAAVERWKAEDAKLQAIGIHGVLQSKSIQALMWNWYSALLPRLEEEIKITRELMSNQTSENKKDDRYTYGPWLEQCDPKKLAAFALTRVLNASASGDHTTSNALKISNLTIAIGRDMEEETNRSIKIRHSLLLRKQRMAMRKDLLTKLTKNTAESKPTIESAPEVQSPTDLYQQKEFPLSVKVRIGGLALDCMIQTAMITVTREDPQTGKTLKSTQRAFHHHTGFVNGKRVGWVEPHHEVLQKLRNEPVDHIHTVKLPMLIEPKPWSDFENGGYYTKPEPVVRSKGGDYEQKTYARSAIENGDLKQMLAGLDVLGKVPWNINEGVFRVMMQAWNGGESIGGLNSLNDMPVRPAEPKVDATPTERMQWAGAMKGYENAKSGLHSERCFQNFQLELARSFLKEKFYYPHSVDFRGRAYPVPPLLNHIGADRARGLLKFANGKELGTVGLQWLKIHLANLFGYDKASLRDREQFAMDHLDEILDSATNPLEGKRWWAQAEDAWQCLACCMELKAALESPDPTRYVSHLPVHQDGTCNGLQHYAALGGDAAGATQVNLEPSDRPQDIYTGVAELVKEMITKDAAKKPRNAYAVMMDGKITRKVVKRTVMTNVYGVTFIGAKEQVLDELKNIFPDFHATQDILQLSYVAMYVARKIFLALAKIFNGAQGIQYWLGECGDRITTSLSPEQIQKIQARFEGKEVKYDAKYNQKAKVGKRLEKTFQADAESFSTGIIWTTPLKMPVVQPYRKSKQQHVKTNISGVIVRKTSTREQVDKRKQLQAFPPNFIHSLDASHMILSALKCHEMGLDFAAVHDSFWTHAADIPTLNVILRDAFVRMHSEDIMGRLAAEFKTRYAGYMHHASILASSPVAQKISQWRVLHKAANKRTGGPSKPFGKATYEELALEQTRQDLLKSDKEEDRKRGQEMVTPTSIWLAHQDPRAFVSARLALLGEHGRTNKLEQVKEKVLGAEADAVVQDEQAAAALKNFEASEDLENVDVAMEAKKEVEPEDSAAEAGDEKPAESKVTKAQSAISVWIPIEFPPLPEKGSWDVQRLRESKYFFS